MAQARGFAEINGNANGAGIVLPESQTADFAIDQIAKNNLLANRQRQVDLQYKAQTNKDFSTNKLAIPPAIQYRSELSGLAQKWYDKGVQYRRQNFNPFNPDYTKPDQVKASEEYLSEKRHIEELADLSKEVDKNYNENNKQVQEGKLDGWDEYQQALKGHSLQSLYKAGGVNALPQLYKRYDTKAVDADIKITPRHQVTSKPVPGLDGVFQNEDKEYVDMPQASRTAERAILNQPGAVRHFQGLGIGNPKDLYTYGGHYMNRDASDPSDFGTIDQPAIMHQMAIDMLTKPEMIKQLPPATKQRILDAQQPGIPLADGSKVTASGKVVKPFDINDDPDFKAQLLKNAQAQFKKEADYQSHIADAVSRNVPKLSDHTKYDKTLADLQLAKSRLAISARGLQLREEGNSRSAAKWREHLADKGTREKWIQDIQTMNTGAINNLISALGEVHGRVAPNPKGGIDVEIPEMVPDVNADGKQTGLGAKKQILHHYHIDKNGGAASRIQIEQVLNKLPTFGKEKGLKTEPYASSYDDAGADDSADDL